MAGFFESTEERTPRVLRYQAGLLELAKSPPADLAEALRKITEVDSKTLGVARVGIWLFNEDRSEIVCQDVYLRTDDRHQSGQKLLAQNYPAYFQALEESRILPASDARHDPRTREFTEGYLVPQQIFSMMDVPIRLGGKVVGIVCHEQVGALRDWSLEDQDFASSIADMVSLAYAAEERRKAEEALQEKTAALERSNRELERFAYVATHDLQEPLLLIIAFADRLERLLGSGTDLQVLDYLRRIQRSGERMRELIDDLLQFSRVTTQAKPFEELELGRILAEVRKDLELRFAASGGRLELGPLPRVFADASQMRQLFQNLLGNALKFRDPRRAPVLRVAGRTISEKFCEISVEDNGIGFEEKYLEQIFRPFTRLHSRSEYEGSGIGLALCEKIVLRHGGTLTAQSRPGHGSKFLFTLPLPPAKP
ncbi:MAG: GAF domain-containing protein [Deltaproteobacteria bacterium]|nr:GAF domain-containing protein [Deltaproteobacteria bacterium]